MTVVRRTPMHRATVVGAVELTPRMRRVTVHAPTLEPPRPAQDIELVRTDDTGRRVKRRYTICNYRAATREFDVDALLHGYGPGARWAATAQPGDEIEFFGPRGKLQLTDADWHLFAGDEAALPAITALAPLVRNATAIVEVRDADDELPLPGADVRWLHRRDAPAGTPDLIAAALADFAPPGGQGHGYLLGESRMLATVRPRLHALGLTDDVLYVKGYWSAGRPNRR